MRLSALGGRRRPSLTPMIDVVFLLLVFFMLSSRFGVETHLPLHKAGASQVPYQGPPRLVSVGAEHVTLNGQVVPQATLADALHLLMDKPDDAILIRVQPATPLQRLVNILSGLSDAGFGNIILLE